MHLVIVESPTKARKLKTYLGAEYKVEASVGHIRDLPKSGLGIDLDNNFEPTYVINDDKTKVIKLLKTAAQQAETVILATDPDREGEAIAWHLRTILNEATTKKSKSTNGETSKLKFARATFHEITKSAVLEAMAKPSELNLDLVDAQQARRVVDRLVGYQVSPVLWRKVRRGLSAGRVQSVALRLIVEREREIEAFIPEEYWEVDVALSTSGQLAVVTKKPIFKEGKAIEELPADVLVARVVEVNGTKYLPQKETDIIGVVRVLPGASYTVQSVERKERTRSSVPPFTTSTLQQAAATRLGFSSKQTMRLAQQLYEEGLITYHRTDSVNLSPVSLQMAREYITDTFGAQYVPEKPRYFSKQTKNAQEAHEAVRVTEAKLTSSSIVGMNKHFTAQHAKLYDLIWRRFLASQMNAAIYEQTSIVIKFDVPAGMQTSLGQTAGLDQANSTQPITYGLVRTAGSVVVFDGWTKLFGSGEEVILPAVTEHQGLGYLEHNAAQKFTQPPPRYNDASLVKELEKKGIGRPSTYASIISVIEDRGYVSRDAKRFVATPVGMTVTDFLLANFTQFMDYEFTAEMEEDLDRISRGEKQWQKVVGTFFTPFKTQVDKALQAAERVQIPVEKTGQTCPTCGATAGGEVVIRSGKFGKFKSCSRYPECDFTENIQEKVEGVVCPLCQQGEVIVKNSRWGKSFFGCSRYPNCDWANWKKPEPGQVITPAEWAEQQAARKERAANRKQFFAKKSGSAKSNSTTTKKTARTSAPKKKVAATKTSKPKTTRKPAQKKKT